MEEYGWKITLELNYFSSALGYKYSFPFLSPECEVSVEDNHVRPLYKHLIHAKFPSLGFIGIPQRIVVFPFVDYQVRAPTLTHFILSFISKCMVVISLDFLFFLSTV